MNDSAKAWRYGCQFKIRSLLFFVLSVALICALARLALMPPPTPYIQVVGKEKGSWTMISSAGRWKVHFPKTDGVVEFRVALRSACDPEKSPNSFSLGETQFLRDKNITGSTWKVSSEHLAFEILVIKNAEERIVVQFLVNGNLKHTILAPGNQLIGSHNGVVATSDPMSVKRDWLGRELHLLNFWTKDTERVYVHEITVLSRYAR